MEMTIQAGDQEIAAIKARLAADEKIYADLRKTLATCIEEANQKLRGTQLP